MKSALLLLALGSCGALCRQLGPAEIPAADARGACAKLASFGCAEGTDSACADVLASGTQTGEVSVAAVHCLSGASSLGQALACDPSGYFTCHARPDAGL